MGEHHGFQQPFIYFWIFASFYGFILYISRQKPQPASFPWKSDLLQLRRTLLPFPDPLFDHSQFFHRKGHGALRIREIRADLPVSTVTALQVWIFAVF